MVEEGCIHTPPDPLGQDFNLLLSAVRVLGLQTQPRVYTVSSLAVSL